MLKDIILNTIQENPLIQYLATCEINGENDDNNKVFNIGFRTPPSDSTGVPHIMEHSVLCGSKNFPAKDLFVELVKGSLNTFLNAMTYPDKTVYPIASCNDVDFKNIMDVYMDAVFYPNIHMHKILKIFVITACNRINSLITVSHSIKESI